MHIYVMYAYMHMYAYCRLVKVVCIPRYTFIQGSVYLSLYLVPSVFTLLRYMYLLHTAYITFMHTLPVQYCIVASRCYIHFSIFHFFPVHVYVCMYVCMYVVCMYV
jgi:hypothetical protein